MSRFSKLELIHHILSSPEPQPSYPLLTPFLLDPLFDDVISPFHDVTTITTRRLITTTTTTSPAHLYLQSLSDRVSALELAFDLEQELNKSKSKPKPKAKSKALVDRKYTWTAEINSGEVDRKYKLTTEIKGGGNNKKKESKWTAEIKSKKNGGKDVKKYTFTALTGESNEDEDEENEVKDKKKDVVNKKKKEKRHRIVEIQDEPEDHGTLLLKQAFDRALERRNKGKKKELSPQDAAMVIQMTFREYLVRRSQSLRALRELAVAKGKLKELRGLFNNFSYRRKVARDAEERQKFSEKVIVLLLTVDAIEGADIMVRAAKRSMVDELEAMLDVVDPQPGGSGTGRSLSMKRRTFDMPDGVIQKELAAGVAQVVRMLGENPEETFEACL